MIHDLSQDSINAQDGMIAIPDGPGLGLSLNESVLKAHIRNR
jgi:L-alanine-DL-glutamate epimerase-like enolase superfamily enzyme